jgi:hypothetical protein
MFSMKETRSKEMPKTFIMLSGYGLTGQSDFMHSNTTSLGRRSEAIA